MRQNNSGHNNKWPRARAGRRSHNALTKTIDSNGPNVKVRGTLSHICRRYQALARDAQAVGDRIRAENFLQHAEHYYRLLSGMQGGAPQGGHASELTPEEGDAQHNGYDTHMPDAYPTRAPRHPRAEHERPRPQERQERYGRQDRPRYKRDRQDERAARDGAHRGNDMPGLPPAVSAPKPVRYEPKSPPASETETNASAPPDDTPTEGA